MEIEKIIDKDNIDIQIKKSGIYHYTYDFEKINSKNVNIKIDDNIDVKLFEKYQSKQNNEVFFNINIDVGANTNVEYNVFNDDLLLKNNKKININLNSNSALKTYILEIANNTNSNYVINLNEEGSRADINLMVYADDKITQNHDIKINHLKPYTISTMNNNGVINNMASCNFNLTSFIKKGSLKSSANQSNRILTLSDNCIAKINPQLLIDEYDVTGSHGTTCGQISDEILYYMESRGIDKILAYRLVAIGSLLKNVSEDLYELLIKKLERRINYE